MSLQHEVSDKSRNINLITMGCSKNLVDSERLMRQLEASGWHLVHNGEVQDARVVVVNTCGFISDAKKESVDMILRCVRAKEEGLIDHLFVMGCLSERYKDELREEIPEVDAFFGARSLDDVLEALQAEEHESLRFERKLTTPSHYAYLKIAEGCNRTCSFCIIPQIRGPYVSRPMEDIVEEARWLASQGVRELLVIAQDLTCYGIDLYKQQMLPELVRRLCAIDGIEWVRLHYMYPVRFPMEILDMMQTEPKLCKYVDIPVQHVSTEVLHKMRRHITSEKTTELLRTIRERVPGVTIRTTLMVGHPGEGKEEFEELVRFVNEFGFDRLGVFTYSHEENTYADNHYDDEVPERVKKERADRIMKLQSRISAARNDEKVGKVLRVIIDREEAEWYVGRTEGDSPEVDGEVLVEKTLALQPGSFQNVRITGAMEYDLTGTPVA